MIADWTSLAPGTQWSHNPMVRLPAAFAPRTNGAARPRATPPATTLRRETLLDCDMTASSLKELVHATRHLLFYRSFWGAPSARPEPSPDSSGPRASGWLAIMNGRDRPPVPEGLRRLAPAEAGGADGYLGAGEGEVEAGLDQRRFQGVPAPRQAFVQPVQAPDIVGMLAGPAEPAIQAQVRAVDRLGLLEPSLLQQQSAQRMPRRLHPAPRLVVGQRVVELDRAPQMGEADIDIAATIFELAAQHLLGDRQQIDDLVVVDPPCLGHAWPGGAERRAR